MNSGNGSGLNQKRGTDVDTKMSLKCLCGRQIELELVGGQYQTTYEGECPCGRVWQLEEISEFLKELDGEDPP